MKNSNVRRWSLAVAVLLIGALVWRCDRNSFPEKHVASREAFDQSIMAFWEADNMFNPKQGQSMVLRTPQQEQVFFGKIKMGIGLSEQVTDEFLDYTHPQLKEMYRNVLIPGKKMYLEGALSGDRVTQTRGSKLVLQWSEFLEAHQEEITHRIYPDGETSSVDPSDDGRPFAGTPLKYS